MNVLVEFIGKERERFAIEDNNKFSISFSQISRYYDFVRIILDRHEKVSRDFVENTKAMRAIARPGSHPVTGEHMALLEAGRHLSSLVHLEIESFYLFAKILLDKMARSLEFYFGPVRERPLDSHDDLVKNIETYARERTCSCPRNSHRLSPA